jgi:hypothetical protein
MDGAQHTVTTHWRPDEEEVAALKAGGLVAIAVRGTSLLPMQVTVEADEKATKSMADRPCRSADGKHTWQFITNAYLTSEGIGAFSIRSVGAYRCRDCIAVKEGEPRKDQITDLGFEELMGVLSIGRRTGPAIKDAADGFYWAHYGDGKLKGTWTIGRLQRSRKLSGVDLDFTDDSGSDRRLSWWIEAGDGTVGTEFEGTDFHEFGITLYGPLKPPTIDGGLLWKLPPVCAEGEGEAA